MQSLIDLHLAYTSGGEVPTQFSRWGIISAIATALGRGTTTNQGRLRYRANLYILLNGLSASRKTMAIKESRGLLREAGYTAFAPDSCSPAEFLDSLRDGFEDGSSGIFLGDLAASMDNPVYISSDEFLSFIGINDMKFITVISDLWDYRDEPYRLSFRKSGKLVIDAPVVNLLGGTTAETLRLCLPNIITGHGFLSRTIMVHSDPNLQKITSPAEPCPTLRQELVGRLKELVQWNCHLTWTPEANSMLDQVYQNCQPFVDGRLQSYFGRRQDHFVKLCMICCCARGSRVISADDVEYANTILAFTETRMSDALGQLGDSKTAKSAQIIMNLLSMSNAPVTSDTLYEAVMQDISNFSDFAGLIESLIRGNKIIRSTITTGQDVSYIPVRVSDQVSKIGINNEKWLEEFRL